MKPSSPLYTLFDRVWAVLFAGFTLLCLLRHNNPFLPMGAAQLLVCGAGAGLLFFLAWRLWQRFGRAPRREARTIGLLLAGYFLALLAFGLCMQVWMGGSWDFTVVTAAARDLVLDGTPPGEYFVNCANNAPLLWLYAGLFRVFALFGIRDFMPWLVAVNAGCIVFSLWCLWRIARGLWGGKWALFALGLAMLCPGFWMYAPIAYTDTLSMPFASAALLLWLGARSAPAARGRGPRLWGAFLLAALGGILRMTCGILIIAFALDLLLVRSWRGQRVQGLLAALCGILLLIGGSRAAQVALPEYDQTPMPLTHWVMMGLRGDGGYNDEDFQLTGQYESYAERQTFVREEILRRLQAMGPGGLAAHCARKLSYILSDGTYYAPSKLDRGARYPNPLHLFIVPNAPYAGFLYYLADGAQLCLLALCAVGAWRAARRPDGLTAARVAVFGLLLFLLVWEARSRYLVQFLPLLQLRLGAGLQDRRPRRAITSKRPRQSAGDAFFTGFAGPWGDDF